MKAERQGWTDLILDGHLKPSVHPARPMGLLDAPRIEKEEHRRRFSWWPTLVLVALMAAIMLAIAYL